MVKLCRYSHLQNMVKVLLLHFFRCCVRPFSLRIFELLSLIVAVWDFDCFKNTIMRFFVRFHLNWSARSCRPSWETFFSSNSRHYYGKQSSKCFVTTIIVIILLLWSWWKNILLILKKMVWQEPDTNISSNKQFPGFLYNWNHGGPN